MPAQFVPLLPGPQSAAEPSHVQTSAAAKHPFVPAASSSIGQQAAASSVAHSSTPELNLKRDGDRIVQIEIRCACGERILLDCNYAG